MDEDLTDFVNDIIDDDTSVEIVPFEKFDKPSHKGWRGGTPPGRPKKGQETKQRHRDRLDNDQTYADYVASAETEDRQLHNPAEPSVPIIREKFEHRALAYMRAQGMSRKDIFERLGGQFNEKRQPISGTGKYSYVHLGNIFNQPWFRKTVLELMHEAGFDQVESAIQVELPTAVETIVEVMNNKKASPSSRLSAANSLLDRGLGKPVQRVEQNNTNSHTHVIEDARELDREIEKVEQELKQLGAGAGK